MTHIDIIAEIGSNHGGDLDEAKRYIEASARAGADVVKFQTLTRDGLIARFIRDADGQVVENPKYAAFGNAGLPDNWHAPLMQCATDNGVEFMSTPFSLEAVDLMERIGVKRYKVASGDMTFAPLLSKLGQTGKPVILSTGASYLDEVEDAIATLKHAGCSDITVLHCAASYPPSWDDLNLSAITTLKTATGRKVGLSDHSPGHTAPIAAAALGAVVIEKHVTFSRSLEGPDHPFAMEMDELAALIADLRLLEQALGDGEKKPAASEINRRRNLRRGRYDTATGHPSADGETWLRPQWEADDRAGK
ncbi:N-acetylneuraminate synthase family protein [Maricaulis parjimensis]|uniref:N-acetylneuraminate synthase family protein n=1 Tax=Maricaulis parjimensis TaxID=144023 RepID=UPI00193942B4|nr:N-acetylneuraminate synthase family protein [Maricaulis parjimensis]